MIRPRKLQPFSSNRLLKHSSSEKNRTGAGSVNLDVTVSAIRVLRIQVVLRAGRLVSTDAMRRTVTRQTKLGDATRR